MNFRSSTGLGVVTPNPESNSTRLVTPEVSFEEIRRQFYGERSEETTTVRSGVTAPTENPPSTTTGSGVTDPLPDDVPPVNIPAPIGGGHQPGGIPPAAPNLSAIAGILHPGVARLSPVNTEEAGTSP